MERPHRDKLGVCVHYTNRFFTDAFAEASAFLVQRSPAYRLDLSNLVARTEYHSRLVLSIPYFAIFFAKGVRRRDLGAFSTFCPKKAPCFGRKPTCYLLLFKVVLAIIVTQDFVGRFSFLSTPCSQSCRRRQFKTVSPPESRLCSAVFQRLSS